jgi:hypothetical protein
LQKAFYRLTLDIVTADKSAPAFFLPGADKIETFAIRYTSVWCKCDLVANKNLIAAKLAVWDK